MRISFSLSDVPSEKDPINAVKIPSLPTNNLANIIALSDFYRDLGYYVYHQINNNNMNQLNISFIKTSINIVEGTINIIHFADLSSAILHKKDERRILELSISALEKGAKVITSSVLSKTKKSFTLNQ